MILEKLLTVVRGCKKLWNFRATPDDECLVVIVLIDLILLVHVVIKIVRIDLVLGKL
jgi:hypothetical protein